MSKTTAVYLGRLHEPGLITRLTLRFLLAKTRKYGLCSMHYYSSTGGKILPSWIPDLRTIVGLHVTHFSTFAYFSDIARSPKDVVYLLNQVIEGREYLPEEEQAECVSYFVKNTTDFYELTSATKI